MFVLHRPEELSIPAAVSLLPLATNHASDVLDMPVDPNEPTYCLCHQVSYGEMIGCDNQDVRTFSELTYCICVFNLTIFQTHIVVAILLESSPKYSWKGARIGELEEA